MKFRLLSLFLILLSSMYAGAQELQTDFKTALDACIEMRSSIKAGDMDGLKQANFKLKKSNAGYFGVLRSSDETAEPSLGNHFIFDTEFADSLIAKGKVEVYKYAQRYAKRGSTRGTSADNNVYIKTIALRAMSTSVYQYRGNGHMELAVVTEPEGMVSLKVVDTKTGAVYKSYDDEKTGQPSRVLTFELPATGNTKLEVHITNYTLGDISCAVISN